MVTYGVNCGFEYDGRKGRFRAYLGAAVVHALGRRASKEARQPPGLDPRSLESRETEREMDRLVDFWKQQ